MIARTLRTGPIWFPPALAKRHGLVLAGGALAAIALAFLPLVWAGVLTAATIGSVLILRYPIAGLIMTVWAVPFGYVETVIIAGAQVSGVDVLLGMLGFVWAARAAARRALTVRPPGLVSATIVFVVLIAQSVRQAPELTLVLKESIKWLEYALAIGLAGSLIESPRDAVIVLAASVAAGLLAALHGWYQFFFQVGPPSYQIGTHFLRAYGTFGQPNPYAGYLSVVLLPVLAILADRLIKRQLSPIVPLIGLAGASAVIGLAILMSFSRGAWLGLALASAILLALIVRRGILVLVIVMVLLGSVALARRLDVLPASIASRLDSIVASIAIFDARSVRPTPENWATVQRMADWQAAWAMFEASPVVGIGLGNFPVVFPDFALPFWRDYPDPHAHNFYLNLLAETGLVGLLGYGILMTATLGWSISIWRRCGEQATTILGGLAISHRALVAGIIAVVMYVWAHSMLDDPFVHGITVQIALDLGILALLVDRRL